MRHYWFPIWKRRFFRPGKEIKGLRGGVHRYAAQASPMIDAARAEKNRFRMETKYKGLRTSVALRSVSNNEDFRLSGNSGTAYKALNTRSFRTLD
jgi:hypothetical protein